MTAKSGDNSAYQLQITQKAFDDLRKSYFELVEENKKLNEKADKYGSIIAGSAAIVAATSVFGTAVTLMEL